MIDGNSFDVAVDKIKLMRKLFPEVFTENKIDFKRLREILGDEVNYQNEHYELNWAGKSEARREVQKQTTATLIPDREGSVNFDTSENIFIEGENLEVLRVLQKSYFGKIRVIYIDPPYNTGNDSFVYPDDYGERLIDYKIRIGEKDKKRFLNKQDLWKKNGRESGHFHSVWLSMIYPRLYLARNLLQEEGVIFISLDDNEAATLKLILDEIFGAENFIVKIIWKKRSTPPNDKIIGTNHDYIFAYAKNKDCLKLNLRIRTIEQINRYKNPDNHPKGDWTAGDLMANVKGGRYVKSLYFPIINPKTGEKHYPSQNGNWRFNEETIKRLIENDEIYFGEDGKGRPKLKRFFSDVKTGVTYPTIWDFVPLNSEGSMEMFELLGNMNIFDNPKPTGLITELIKLGAEKDSIILDFFAGSGTTAQAVLDLNCADNGNRKFICVQLPEQIEENAEAFKANFSTISDICKARLRKVISNISTGKTNGSPTCIGFKSFKLEQSNFKVWRTDTTGEQAILNQLEMFVNSEIDTSTTENMLYELLLKTGVPLTTKIEIISVSKQNLFLANNGKLLIFFDRYELPIKDLILQRMPEQVICLDRVFLGNDQALTNFKLELTEKGISLIII